MSRFFTVMAACAALLGASGCGFTSSPADKLTFKAPAGWQASPGIMGFMQFWKAPGSSDEVLMLLRSPKRIPTSDVMTTANVKDAKIESTQNVTICNGQPAEFVKAQGTAQSLTTKADNSNLQMMISDAGGTTYMAMYLYPIKASPKAQAVAALHELCTK